MAVLAVAQQDVIDVTDGYSVMLTSETHTFEGTETAAVAASTKTKVLAFHGTEAVAVTVNISDCVCPSGVTIAKNSDTTTPTLTISVASTVTQGGTVTIPVAINDGSGVVIEKLFTFAIAFAGTDGQNGSPGADALSMVITSSNGFIFKNTSVVTTLTAHVFRGISELSASQISALGTIRWYKDSGSSTVGTGTTLSITAGQVVSKATYKAQLES